LPPRWLRFFLGGRRVAFEVFASGLEVGGWIAVGSGRWGGSRGVRREGGCADIVSVLPRVLIVDII
jgi:hypothetical protein